MGLEAQTLADAIDTALEEQILQTQQWDLFHDGYSDADATVRAQIDANIQKVRDMHHAIAEVVAQEVVKHISDYLKIAMSNLTGATVTAFNMDDVLPEGVIAHSVTAGGKSIQSGFQIFGIEQDSASAPTMIEADTDIDWGWNDQ